MQKGFLLIELLVTIVLVAVLAVISMPSFLSLITVNRMASEINEFTDSLHLTRTEIVKRGEMHNSRGVILSSSEIILASDTDDPTDHVRNDSKKNLKCG